MAPAEILVNNKPIITVSQFAGTVYRSLLALDVFGNAVVGTSPIVFLLNSVAIIPPYNATAIAIAKDSDALEAAWKVGAAPAPLDVKI